MRRLVSASYLKLNSAIHLTSDFFLNQKNTECPSRSTSLLFLAELIQAEIAQKFSTVKSKLSVGRLYQFWVNSSEWVSCRFHVLKRPNAWALLEQSWIHEAQIMMCLYYQLHYALLYCKPTEAVNLGASQHACLFSNTSDWRQVVVPECLVLDMLVWRKGGRMQYEAGKTSKGYMLCHWRGDWQARDRSLLVALYS